MIGKLTGYVDLIKEDCLILNVNDVGYLIYCSGKTLNLIQDKKDKISLLIETIVKEDSITLFGFIDSYEKNCFNMLCKVSGVGNKMAIKILTVADYKEIISGISNKDKSVFVRASGVGDKVASRILTELEKHPLVKNFNSIILNKDINEDDNLKNVKDLINDSIKALESLGYQKSFVQQIVIKLLKEKPFLTLESVITESLKILNKF